MGLRIYDESCNEPEENLLGQFIPLHYHFNMLQDTARVSAFRRAIEIAVRPGMRVLELGGGTGILSFFAARQGASVWCVERNPELAETARQLMARNRAAGTVQVIEADAAEYLPAGPVDVVICEMLHVAMLREKQLDIIASFKDRYTKLHGDQLPQFIPDSSLLAVQPVEHEFNFAGYHAPIPMFQAPDERHEQTRSLAELLPYASIFYDQAFPRHFSWTGDIRIDHSGTVTALRFVTHNLVGFEDSQTPVSWSNQFLILPVATPVHVRAGQALHVCFGYTSGEPLTALADSIAIHAESVSAPLQRAA